MRGVEDVRRLAEGKDVDAHLFGFGARAVDSLVLDREGVRGGDSRCGGRFLNGGISSAESVFTSEQEGQIVQCGDWRLLSLTLDVWWIQHEKGGR